MLQVSPASGAERPGRAVPGADEVPEAQPSGERTFGRVIPERRRAGRGRGRTGRDELGVRAGRRRSPTARRSATRWSPAFEDALARRRRSDGGAELALLRRPARHQPATLAEASAADGQRRRAGARASREPAGTLPPRPRSTRRSSRPRARSSPRAFEAEYGRRPGRYAAYGYEAMAVILDSIERASDPTDRAAVIDAFFATAERDSVLGTYSIDELGETTLEPDDRLRARAGRRGRSPSDRRPASASRSRERRLDRGNRNCSRGRGRGGGSPGCCRVICSASSSPRSATSANRGAGHERRAVAAPCRAPSRTRGW